MKDSRRTLLRTLSSLKWAAWYTISIKFSLQPNSWTRYRTKSPWGTVIKRAVEYSLKYITFFHLCYPTSGLQGTAPWRFFRLLWLDLDLSEGLSKVSLFIFFTIPAMKPSRVIFQPSFFNDSSLLKSHDITEVEPGHIVHWILAFNTCLSFGWAKLYKAVASKISAYVHRMDIVKKKKKAIGMSQTRRQRRMDCLSSVNESRDGAMWTFWTT